MKKLMKWLTEHNIDFYIVKRNFIDYIVIMLEPGCIWINGFGEPMKYDKKIMIYKNTYNEYIVNEVIGYNQVAKLIQCSKVSNAINILDKRLL
jgi:hypothetical protein